jgi:hypothetical protein
VDKLGWEYNIYQWDDKCLVGLFRRCKTKRLIGKNWPRMELQSVCVWFCFTLVLALKFIDMLLTRDQCFLGCSKLGISNSYVFLKQKSFVGMTIFRDLNLRSHWGWVLVNSLFVLWVVISKALILSDLHC